MISGRKTILTPGHPERLWPTDVGRLQRVEVDVLPDNTDDTAVYIGGPQTTARTGGEMGRPLWQRDRGGDSWVRLDINPYHIYVDVQDGNGGEGVSILLHGIGDE